VDTPLERYLARNPEISYELYLIASEIVDDFEDYGPQLPANENNVFDEGTTIRRFQTLRNRIIEQSWKERHHPKLAE